MTLVKFNQPKLMNGFMNEFLNELPTVFGKTFTTQPTMPAVNITETNDAYRLELVAPGRNKEDFKVNVDNNILTISYETKKEEKNENEKQIRKEFSFQSFKRTFTLDDKIVAENILAKYENGLLIVTLPRKEEVKITPKEIAIQ